MACGPRQMFARTSPILDPSSCPQIDLDSCATRTRVAGGATYTYMSSTNYDPNSPSHQPPRSPLQSSQSWPLLPPSLSLSLPPLTPSRSLLTARMPTTSTSHSTTWRRTLFAGRGGATQRALSTSAPSPSSIILTMSVNGSRFTSVLLLPVFDLFPLTLAHSPPGSYGCCLPLLGQGRIRRGYLGAHHRQGSSPARSLLDEPLRCPLLLDNRTSAPQITPSLFLSRSSHFVFVFMFCPRSSQPHVEI